MRKKSSGNLFLIIAWILLLPIMVLRELLKDC